MGVLQSRLILYRKLRLKHRCFISLMLLVLLNTLLCICSTLIGLCFQYYYNASTSEFMYWDAGKSTYLPAPTNQQENAEKTNGEKKEKKDKVKVAKKIAKVTKSLKLKLVCATCCLSRLFTVVVASCRRLSYDYVMMVMCGNRTWRSGRSQ